MTGSKKLVILAHKPNTDDLEYLKQLVIDKCYTLADTAKAIAYLGEGHAKGKVVITVPHDDGN